MFYGAICFLYKACYNRVKDCLYLSVYTSRRALEKKANLAGYLYFHGGAYAAGASSLQDGAYIAETQNIVVVTANYRLGRFNS